MRQPHKHAELIKAWADGAEIEYRTIVQDQWFPCNDTIGWYPAYEYRIKPETKPDVVITTFLGTVYGSGYLQNKEKSDCNIKLTFDGETGKLKSAEVI